MTSSNGNIFRVTGYWPFVRGIHRWPVNSPHKASDAELDVFFDLRLNKNGWVNNRDPSDLRRHRTHYDVTVMWSCMERSCPAPYMSLKRKCLHFDEIFITGCTGSCQNDNFQCSQWLKFRQNDNIFVSVCSACRWWPLGMHAAFVRWYIRTQYKVGKTHFGKICHTPRKCIFLLKTSFRTWVSIDDITHGWLIFCVLLWFVSVVFYWYPLSVTMMTSSGGNIFRVT